MGLDQYLKASKYVSDWEFSSKIDPTYNNLLKLMGLTREDVEASNTPSATVEFNIAYWRKANAVHKWFVDNVQDGKDECQHSYVSREQLQELVNNCNHILKNKGAAKNVLPSKSGFFFGNTDYDDGYYDNLEYTSKRLTEILNNPKFKGWDFYYQSSW